MLATHLLAGHSCGHSELPSAPAPAPIVNSCGCGRTYTRAQWDELPLRGYQETCSDHEELELRNCPCGSTRALTVRGRKYWHLPGQHRRML